ncbi:DNA-binding response regulator [Sphingorhabdus pulchriflava]|uniref:DNA-binding response regulator n=1 Tax=Sphingorhabdus pulchriflava TaxID=2292257 RepID=A0A371BEN2_9SPHN|nr:LytTR family DNA-binding domain-containing protein [Sphingorhabdus pulchriflava]RDV06059.1 DNA-binding response regulator [Sphingorhabdus pulchriflava]
MTKLRTIIVDDEPLAVERLQILCASEPAIDLVGTASDGAAALRLAQSLTPDLILLDIGMPKMDGISVARAVAMMERKPAIIFVTAYDNFAVEAFDLDVVDYMLKPVSAERLGRAISRAVAGIAEQDSGQGAASSPGDAGVVEADSGFATEFWVSHRSELIRVAAADIDRIEAERDYMRLHTGGRSYLLHQTISTLEQRLDPSKFQRIHRSHIIRRDLVTGLRHEGGGVWHAILQGDQSMRIGRKYLADVKKLAGK